MEQALTSPAQNNRPCPFHYLSAPLFLLVLFLLLMPAPTAAAGTALVRVNNENFPGLPDDLGTNGELNQAVDRSLDFLRSRPESQQYHLADQKIQGRQLIDALTAFQRLLAQDLSPEALQKSIRQQFVLLQVVKKHHATPNHSMLVTGYYQPVFDGRLQKQTPYVYPLYAVPPDLVVRAAQGTGGKQIGRIQGKQLLPYWTREEIDSQGKAAGSEIVWLKDPLDVFFLHIQGSGLIRLGNGVLRGIHYATGNGRPYRSIGKYMVQTGRMNKKTASMKTIRTYIETHPGERNEILFTNPSYIFFSWTETKGAIGSLGQELTPGRSIAVDQKIFPAGGLAFLKTREPVVTAGRISTWKAVHRFVLAQDTGSAIKGSGRVDLFQGAGREAGLVAGAMKETGNLYFLLCRSDMP
jgi:membrane-bound lytic murein transglycosylase A